MKLARRWGLVLGAANVHTKKACRATRAAGGPEHCVLHCPSGHHMRDWRMTLRVTGLIERICHHGIGHPDPDSVAYFIWRNSATGLGIHGCDGCCRP